MRLRRAEPQRGRRPSKAERLRRTLAGTALVLGFLPSNASAGVQGTRHDLSVTGPGSVRAASDTRICIFCHTPHNASPSGPLWNRRDPGGTYVPYTSSTAASAPGQPDGASLLCLSCHDGTIALGDVRSESVPIALAGGVGTMPAGRALVGTALLDDHPVSLTYDDVLAALRELVPPASLTGAVRLDPAGKLQCTACHDPHDDTLGDFLVATTRASALCRTCHVPPEWPAASHALSTRTWNGTGADPWPQTAWTTVADNACESCHTPHAAGGPRLLASTLEEDGCLGCHTGSVATENVGASFAKLSRHPLTSTTGVHDPTEPAIAASRHVECVDCHDPHAARPGSGPTGVLAGVRGVSLAAAEVRPVQYEYEVCFRCHADSPGKPPGFVPRWIEQTNVRLEFDPANPSFHPVAAPGRNANVPSLIAPLSITSVIRCGDCHADDAGPGAGGTAPSGPHGSAWSPLLERRYVTADGTVESAGVYALCYKCHSRTSILGDQSFPEHRKHIEGERAPCSVCHDAHGISRTQGNDVNQSRLINFDRTVVSARTNGDLRFESRAGTFRGACYLRCHGKDHAPLTY